MSPAVNTWYHIAIVRQGNDYKVYINGNLDISYNTATAISEPDYVLTIGTIHGENWLLRGWLDEFRISKGIARWTSNFIPPTEEYNGISSDPPIANAGPDAIASVGVAVTLDGSISEDLDGYIVSWIWRSLSDPENPIVAEGRITTMNAHGFVEELIELTVTDNAGDTATDTMKVSSPGVSPDEIADLEVQVQLLEQENTNQQTLIDTLQQENTQLQNQLGAVENQNTQQQTEIGNLQDDNSQQQQLLDDNRYLIEQLPQLKHDLEALQNQTQP